jgi:GPH family glycoside/pentoside/hexuronide:cation symporter
MVSDAPKPMSTGMAAGWAIGTLCSTFLLYVTNTFYLRFMTDYVGLSAGIAGSLLASMKLFEMFTNPLTGIVTDKAPAWFGRRRPFLLIGAVLSALGLVLMFSVPSGLSPGTEKLCAVAVLVIGSIGYTIFNVPYLAMLAEMTNDPVERARLVSYRVYVLAFGQFAAGGIAPLLVSGFGGDRKAYSSMAAIFGVVIIGAAIICFAATRRAAATMMSTRARTHFFGELRSMFRSRLYTCLLLAKATLLIGASAHTVTAAFYVRYVLHSSDKTLSLFLFAYSGGIVLSQYLWFRLSAGAGKIVAYTAAALLYVVVSIIWSLMSFNVPVPAIILLSLLNGAGAGGVLLVSEAMLPDAIEEDYRISGIRREGTLASGFAFAEKAANAVGVALVGLVLSSFGYQAATAKTGLSPSALTGVMTAFGLMPAFFVGASCLWWLGVRRRREPAAAALS